MPNPPRQIEPTSSGYDRESAKRALGGLALGVVVGLGIGGLAAPPLFHALIRLGRAYSPWSGLRELGFESVASRCGLIAVLLTCGLNYRLGWLGTSAQLGLVRTGLGRAFLRWAGLGLLTMVALYSAGLAAGAYRIALPGSVQASAVIVAVILGALGVGWIEEVAFRGVMYGAARAVLGVPGAALATSLLFSLIHFADPIPFHSVAYPDWKDGLLLLGSLFRFVHGPDYYIPYAATLLVMGLVLCRVYETTGGVIACIGLHAGWVAGLFGLKEWLVREPGVATAAFGSGSNPATGWAALLLLTAWLVLVGRPRGGTHADAQRSTVA